MTQIMYRELVAYCNLTILHGVYALASCVYPYITFSQAMFCIICICAFLIVAF